MAKLICYNQIIFHRKCFLVGPIDVGYYIYYLKNVENNELILLFDGFNVGRHIHAKGLVTSRNGCNGHRRPVRMPWFREP